MKIRVNPHNVEIVREETEPINELEVKVSKCEFEFDEKITNEFVKEAYFTLNGSTYKQIIVNNECDYPNEVLTEKGTLEIGVVAYKVENEEEIIRYNPSPDYYDTWEGSLKDAENTEPLTPTDKEQMQSQISQNTSDISDLQANKQDKLTQGDNITIDENNVISATDTIYDDTEIKADIQELQETKIDKDANNLTYYTLTTETGSKITLSIDSSTYVMTLKLKDKNNNDISTTNVDLPLETMVVGARYDSATKEIVLTLKNGQEVRFSVADLVSGLQTEITENNKLSSDLVDDTNSTNKFVSASEKEQITTNKNDITAIKDGQSIDSFSDVETELGLKEDKSNKVTEINSSSTDTQYPSAKCVYESQTAQDTEIDTLKMIYNILPTDTDTGETISIDNTGEMPIKSIQLGGNTTQEVIPGESGTNVNATSISISDVNTSKEHYFELDGNTYQETTTGKNYAIFEQPDTTISGLTITYDNATGKISIKGKATSTTGVRVSKQMQTNIPSGTYTLSINSALPVLINYVVTDSQNNNTAFRMTAGSTSVTNTLSNNGVQASLFVSIENNVDYDLEFYMQLESGSTPTSFEKFSYGPSPNPSYPQDIEVVTGENDITIEGKNLFDKNNMVLNSYIRPNGSTLSTDYWDISNYINVLPNEQYTYQGLTTIGTDSIQSAYYDKNKNFISVFKQAIGNNTITIPNNVYYVRFSINKSSNDKETLMIEKGSTATTYEQYQGTTYPINLGNIELCKISTYKDRIYKSNDKWYLEKKTGKITLNGTETNWETAQAYGKNYPVISIDNLLISTSISAIPYLYSNYYQEQILSAIVSNTPLDYGIGKRTNNAQLLFRNKDTATLRDFQTWLNTHNTIVYYALATPTTTEITDTTLVNQLNALYSATIYPITNINTDTSNLLPYIDLHYNFITPSPSPSKPSAVNVVKGNNTITISNSNNTESQSYPINLGDMELCKIETYQDYIYESNGNWFKKSNIGKVVLNGSENWQTELYTYYLTNFNAKSYSTFSPTAPYAYANYFKWGNGSSGSFIEGCFWYTLDGSKLRVEKDNPLDLNAFKTWLSTHNTIVYYVLATPTDTQITDTTLITQLNNIKKAYSYNTQTNISQTNEDKPFIITAEMFLSLKNVFE